MARVWAAVRPAGPAPITKIFRPFPSLGMEKYAFSLATLMFSAHSPGLPTPALVIKERMQLRQPMQRRISFSRPEAAFSTQWGSQIKARAEATKSWSPSCSCRSACSGARITFLDSGVPYDPLQKEDPDITLPAAQRDIGGLGIFMVKKSMDNVQYAYLDGKNILTLTKKIL